MSPTERLVFYREHIYLSVRYKSFYKPEKVSEALGYIWICDPRERWSRILKRLKATGRHSERTEEQIRNELTLIGDRRDLIAHSMDIQPGMNEPNPVSKQDAARVIELITDLAASIDQETEAQLA